MVKLTDIPTDALDIVAELAWEPEELALLLWSMYQRWQENEAERADLEDCSPADMTFSEFLAQYKTR